MGKRKGTQIRKRFLVISPTAERYRAYCEENGITPGKDALYCSGPDVLRGRRPNEFSLVWDEEVWFRNIKEQEWETLNKMAMKLGFTPSPNYILSSFREIWQ